MSKDNQKAPVMPILSHEEYMQVMETTVKIVGNETDGGEVRKKTREMASVTTSSGVCQDLRLALQEQEQTAPSLGQKLACYGLALGDGLRATWGAFRKTKTFISKEFETVHVQTEDEEKVEAPEGQTAPA